MKSFQGVSKIFSSEAKAIMLFDENENHNVGGDLVEFSPKARNAWYAHPSRY